MNITLDQDWIEAFLLASVRMVAFLVIAPPFSYNAFPARIKAMLGLGLGLAIAPQVSEGYNALSTGAFFMAIVMELLVGFVLGFLVMVVFSAVQSAGNLIDTFGGFQLAQAFDPQSMVNGAQFTRIFQITALALLFASDGYQLIIGGLLRSFTALPLTGGLDLSSPVSALTAAVSQMFLASVQIAGPLLVVLFLADAGLGLLTRVAPALNAFALGFPLKILLTLSLASVVFLALPRIVSGLVSTIERALTGVG
ncbi:MULTISPECIES: flagellar biosynthetic protein FliR [unclassified Arthrobacter]|uniref:flagellar biosynthetic protein FliR n=1 Tax=unclassified Arthrobacter TaxID=235627 RepID=UPI0021034361|nr:MULTISPECIES: flagellar biosynthetic protein FliR [unclassified Arthrobacter]MCQ1948284.1 flagellar biosynthetic protein FliR [Arthrobacter sp. zg-Y1116]MCQ1988060.1 flagellar biosynthetic protein FliR [Arthrobacter sp. zg-Y844]MCQ1996661.1 flagellar biosynthetic protein FliR [Arthrobacter sp. zg-Y1171]UWX82258.1 flagellar biosynthetic protein FliR [Arthrobacter sp. zg-Y1171]